MSTTVTPLPGGGWLSCGLNVELGADELQLDALPDGRRLADWTRVSSPYSEIWDILHQFPKAALYYYHSAMRMRPVS